MSAKAQEGKTSHWVATSKKRRAHTTQNSRIVPIQVGYCLTMPTFRNALLSSMHGQTSIEHDQELLETRNGIKVKSPRKSMERRYLTTWNFSTTSSPRTGRAALASRFTCQFRTTTSCRMQDQAKPVMQWPRLMPIKSRIGTRSGSIPRIGTL